MLDHEGPVLSVQFSILADLGRKCWATHVRRRLPEPVVVRLTWQLPWWTAAVRTGDDMSISSGDGATPSEAIKACVDAMDLPESETAALT